MWVFFNSEKFFYRSQFLTDVREILGTPEWMLTVDNRKTKILHSGACVQLLFHFKGNIFHIGWVNTGSIKAVTS